MKIYEPCEHCHSPRVKIKVAKKAYVVIPGAIAGCGHRRSASKAEITANHVDCELCGEPMSLQSESDNGAYHALVACSPRIKRLVGCSQCMVFIGKI